MNQINVTGKNKTEENDLVFSNAFLKSVAMSGPSLIAIIRCRDMKIFFVNDQFTHYLGYTNADLAGNGVYVTDLLSSYQLPRLLYQFNTVKENNAACSRYVIYQLKNKNGKIAPFYLYAVPVANENNAEEMYYLTMNPDLSKWDMPFTSFNTRELFLEQFNSEDFGTFEWIIDSDKVLWSLGIYHIYEVDENLHDINAKFIETFVNPNDKDRIKEATKNAFDTGEDINVEYKIITAKQNVKTIHCLARVIKNTEGKGVMFAGSIRDVTEQRSIEENLKNKVEQLNHSNRELEEFAYVASHDMQEPLRKITTFSDRLAEKYKDVLAGDGAMYLTRMIASAENMRMLIKDLLEFSRISKTEQPFEHINLNTILLHVMTDLELIIEETGTVINSHKLPAINAVSSQMKQLFTNIINNAIKFRKEGVSPVITIEAGILSQKEKIHYELAPNITYHKIQVTDNGIGFEDEYAIRIFQVFQRLHGKSEYPGSGIGLAICKKILEYHHGIIYAENVAGSGARFVFILPQEQ